MLGVPPAPGLLSVKRLLRPSLSRPDSRSRSRELTAEDPEEPATTPVVVTGGELRFRCLELLVLPTVDIDAETAATEFAERAGEGDREEDFEGGGTSKGAIAPDSEVEVEASIEEEEGADIISVGKGSNSRSSLGDSTRTGVR